MPSALSLAVIIASYVAREAAFLTSRLGWLIVLCGRNSLYVRCLTILRAVLANFLLSLAGGTLIRQVLINLAGVAVMACQGVLLAWFKSGGHWPERPRCVVAA